MPSARVPGVASSRAWSAANWGAVRARAGSRAGRKPRALPMSQNPSSYRPSGHRAAPSVAAIPRRFETTLRDRHKMRSCLSRQNSAGRERVFFAAKMRSMAVGARGLREACVKLHFFPFSPPPPSPSPPNAGEPRRMHRRNAARLAMVEQPREKVEDAAPALPPSLSLAEGGSPEGPQLQVAAPGGPAHHPLIHLEAPLPAPIHRAPSVHTGRHRAPSCHTRPSPWGTPRPRRSLHPHLAAACPGRHRFLPGPTVQEGTSRTRFSAADDLNDS